nr:unnamed protein product [Callosobruchus chinensis]
MDWVTPPQRSICLYEEEEKRGYTVPTPFKKCLVFPRTPDSKAVRAPNQRKTLFPAVVSSGKYREYYNQKFNKIKKKQIENPINTESTSESDEAINFGDVDLDMSDPEDETIIAGQHVIVKYEDKYYPGLVLKHDPEGAEVRSMVCAGIGSWKWPPKDDILYYFNEDIVCMYFSVPEMEQYE